MNMAIIACKLQLALVLANPNKSQLDYVELESRQALLKLMEGRLRGFDKLLSFEGKWIVTKALQMGRVL